MEAKPQQQAQTYRREKFYIRTGLWGHGLSANAIAVYSYLSYCANRDGDCSPTIERIANECSLSVRTVRSIVHRLEEVGLIRIERSHQFLQSGRRQAANIYHLLPVQPAKNAPIPCKKQQGDPARNAGEINNKQININTLIQSSSIQASSVQASAQDAARAPSANADGTDADGAAQAIFQYPEELTDAEILQGLIDSLELDLFYDRNFSDLVDMTVRQMYYASSTRIDGTDIPQERVRERLHRLNIDCIDYVQAILYERGESIKNIGNYLAACLYKAPMELCEDAIRFYASLPTYKPTVGRR